MSKIAYQGETVILVGETALDLTDYDEIRVIVYDRNNNIILKAAQSVATAGYDTTIFRAITGATGQFEVIIAPEVTEVAKPGKYYAEVQTKYDDTDWTQYVYDLTQDYIFELRHAKL